MANEFQSSCQNECLDSTRYVDLSKKHAELKEKY